MQRKQVFQGVNVVDLGWWVVWPLAVKHLADFGANVVRIERSVQPPERRNRPFKDGIFGFNRSGYYNENNTSKYSLTLDLKNPKGYEVAKKLVQWADIVGEAFTPGTVAGWGLDYETCRKIKPDIIYISSSGVGQAGPDAEMPLYGHIVNALSGFNHVVGWPDRAPVGPYGPFADYYTTHLVTTTMVAALVRKRKTGKGTYIDVASAEAVLWGGFETYAMDYLVNGREQTRMGNRHPYAAPHGAYLCQGGDFPPAKLPALEMKDRWCAIAVFTDEEWQRFCKVIGEPAWTKDPKFATLASRKQNEDELDRLVGQWTRDYSAEEVMYLMQAGGVAAGVVQTNQDLSEDAQLRHRGHWVLLDHKEIGPSYYNNYGWRLSKTPAQHKPVPLLGEHNEYVLRDFLGMSDEEIAEMAAARIFEARLTG